MLISKKIGILVGLAMMTSAAVSTLGLYGLKQVNGNMVEISEHSVPALLLVSEIRATYLASIPLLYDRASTPDATKGTEIEKQMEATYQLLRKQVKDYTDRTTDEAEKAALLEL